MSIHHDPDAVQPALRRAEAEVARRLEEACEDVEQKDLSQESLNELLRLENELLAAARAVEETVKLRRQLGERPASVAQPRESPTAPPAQQPPAEADTPGCRLRDFLDAAGREWRVWEVKPGASGRPTNPERYLGEYFKGWLAFECLQDEVRKRMPNYPTDWFRMTDADLDRLLPRAVDVPKRPPKAMGASTP
jgi:hypothetical protein